MAADRRSEVWHDAARRAEILGELALVGANIRSARLRLNLTLEQLAEKASLHPVTLSRIENGHVNLTVATLVALARALDVEVRELFRTSNSRTRGVSQ